VTRSWLGRGALSGAIAAAAVLGTAAPAAADELEIAVVGGGPLFQMEDAEPGSTGSAELRVTNESSSEGSLSVQVVNLVEDDNGCNAAEARAGDTTCGAGGGELGAHLLVTVTDGDGDTLFDGSLRDLTTTQVLDGALAAGATEHLVFTWLFDPTSGDDTQSDRVAFDVDVALTEQLDVRQKDKSAQASGDRPPAPPEQPAPGDGPVETDAGGKSGVGGRSAVSAAGVERGQPAQVAGAVLARTGANVMNQVITGTALVVLGTSLVRLLQRRTSP
jgi:hypothetical protein